MQKKANPSDLIAKTGIVILHKFDPNPTFWPVWHLTEDIENNREPITGP